MYRNRQLSSTCWAIGVTGNVFDESPLRGNDNGSLLAAPFGALLDAEITPETNDFFVSDAEGDPDCPTEGFSSMEQALAMLRQGKVCIHCNAIFEHIEWWCF